MAMGVLCAASQGVALRLATVPSEATIAAASSSSSSSSSTFLFPARGTAKALRVNGEGLRKGGVNQGLASSLGGIHWKRERRGLPATTESSEVVEGQQSQEEADEDDMSSSSSACETLCTTTWGLCDTVIGVLGGGQLGRMLCQAASPMGIRVSVLDPLPDCPAGKIAFHHQVGSFKDMVAVREFAKGCGALTVEIEHVDVETLEALARENVDIEPKPFTIRIIQVF